MHLTFLGTGTSTGVPLVNCDCCVCTSTDAKDKRLRSSVLLEYENTKIIVDTTPDLRTQLLREKIRKLDAVLLTHTHADHLLGFDDVRLFCIKQKISMPVYLSELDEARFREVFFYAFESPKNASVPKATLHPLRPFDKIKIGDIKIQSLDVRHGHLSIFGYRFDCKGKSIAYITDATQLPKETVQAITGVDVLVLNALRHRPHPMHMPLASSIEFALKINAKETFFTHIADEMLHEKTNNTLPKNINLAYDGLVVGGGE